MNGHARHWIDGAWLDSAQRDNPSTRPAASRSAPTPTAGGPRPMRRSPPLCAPSKMVPGRTTTLRATALEEIAAAFERHADALIDLLALENGKIKPEAAFEVGMVPGKLRYYAGLARSERAPAARRAPTWCRWCCASRWASPASSCRGIHRWC